MKATSTVINVLAVFVIVFIILIAMILLISGETTATEPKILEGAINNCCTRYTTETDCDINKYRNIMCTVPKSIDEDEQLPIQELFSRANYESTPEAIHQRCQCR